MSVLEFREVTLKSAGVWVLDAVSFSARGGEVLAAFGRSGSGKHELIQLAAGVLEPSRGEVKVNEEGRWGAAYVMNEGGLINNMTLLDNVVLPALYHRRLGSSEARSRALELLGALGLERQAGLRPASVGHNARRLAQLARAQLLSPALYVLDDPFEELDADGMKRVRGALKAIRDEGRSAVLLAAGNLGPYLDWATKFLWVRRAGVELFEGREALRLSASAEVKVFLGEA